MPQPNIKLDSSRISKSRDPSLWISGHWALNTLVVGWYRPEADVLLETWVDYWLSQGCRVVVVGRGLQERLEPLGERVSVVDSDPPATAPRINRLAFYRRWWRRFVLQSEALLMMPTSAFLVWSTEVYGDRTIGEVLSQFEKDVYSVPCCELFPSQAIRWDGVWRRPLPNGPFQWGRMRPPDTRHVPAEITVGGRVKRARQIVRGGTCRLGRDIFLLDFGPVLRWIQSGDFRPGPDGYWVFSERLRRKLLWEDPTGVTFPLPLPRWAVRRI